MSDAKCFVVQPFNEKFNKRFDDLFGPAIASAKLEPYRVDRDFGASIPIETIEKQIREASVCFCDISEDNPNVWFELGFAIASGKQLCLVREESSTRPLPFDVRHRSVIFYKVESSSDFVKLGEKITSRLKAISESLAQADKLAMIVSEDRASIHGGLSERDLTCLNQIASYQYGPQDNSSFHVVLRVMTKAGYTQVATQLALRSLLKQELIKSWDAFDQDDGAAYVAYAMEDQGWDLLESKLGEADMKLQPSSRKEVSS